MYVTTWALKNYPYQYYELERDYSFYQTILRKWITWLSDLGIPRNEARLGDGIPEANQIWDDIQKRRSTVAKISPKVNFWKRLPYV